MKMVIEKAVRKNVALEIQAESHFSKPRFLKLVKRMGAKFLFGSNNSTDKTKDLSNWFNAIQLLDLKQSDILAIKSSAQRQSNGEWRDPIPPMISPYEHHRPRGGGHHRDCEIVRFRPKTGIVRVKTEVIFVRARPGEGSCFERIVINKNLITHRGT